MDPRLVAAGQAIENIQDRFSNLLAHPGPWLHAQVADALYKIIAQLPHQPRSQSE